MKTLAKKMPQEIWQEILAKLNNNAKLRLGSVSREFYRKIHENMQLYICNLRLMNLFNEQQGTYQNKYKKIKDDFNLLVIYTRQIEGLSKNALLPSVQQKAALHLQNYEGDGGLFLDDYIAEVGEPQRKTVKRKDYKYLSLTYKHIQEENCCDECWKDCCFDLSSCCRKCKADSSYRNRACSDCCSNGCSRSCDNCCSGSCGKCILYSGVFCVVGCFYICGEMFKCNCCSRH